MISLRAGVVPPKQDHKTPHKGVEARAEFSTDFPPSHTTRLDNAARVTQAWPSPISGAARSGPALFRRLLEWPTLPETRDKGRGGGVSASSEGGTLSRQKLPPSQARAEGTVL